MRNLEDFIAELKTVRVENCVASVTRLGRKRRARDTSCVAGKGLRGLACF